MYLAKQNPEQFSTLLHLFSFAGFLRYNQPASVPMYHYCCLCSFLRSVDNCVTDRKHEVVYQVSISKQKTLEVY